MKTFCIALLALLIQTSPAPQQANASLEGVVLQLGSNALLSKATVELRGLSGNAAPISTTTDDQGKFVFPILTPGPYRMFTTRDGYMKMEYGQRRPSGSSALLTLAAGQRMTNVRVTMTPGGSVSGRVTDRGEPAAITDVFALKATFIEGQLTLNPVLSAKTNDLGEYHIFWLPPGRYYIGTMVWDTAAGGTYPIFVNPDSSENAFYPQRRNIRFVMNKSLASGVKENEAHPFMYHPGTPDPQAAAVIDVKPGSDLHGIDVKADVLPAWHIRGRITGIPQVSLNGQQVPPSLNLYPITASFTRNAIVTQVSPDGSFDISKVNPGQYVLSARVSPGNATVRVSVDVLNRDIDGLILNLATGFEVSGRVVIDRPVGNNAPDPPIAALRLALRPDPLLPGVPATVASPNIDGTFTIPARGFAPPGGRGQPPGVQGVTGGGPAGLAGGPGLNAAAPLGLPVGDYRVLITPILQAPSQPGSADAAIPASLQAVYVKSIRFGELDVLNNPLQLRSQPQDPLVITLGVNPGSVEGRLLDGRQQPLANGTVVLVPDSSLRFKVDHKFATTDPAGRFQIPNVPPGDYEAFAWEDVEKGAWQDPEFLRGYDGRGKGIHVDEGGKVVADLAPLPLN